MQNNLTQNRTSFAARAQYQLELQGAREQVLQLLGREDECAESALEQASALRPALLRAALVQLLEDGLLRCHRRDARSHRLFSLAHRPETFHSGETLSSASRAVLAHLRRRPDSALHLCRCLGLSGPEAQRILEDLQARRLVSASYVGMLAVYRHANAR